jgi:hypothetical protein
MIDCEEWDWPLLKKHWGIRRPMIFTKAEFDEIPFGSHVFIASGKRFYDAECAEGVDDFFNLPIFRRSIIRALQEKGIILDAQDIQLMQDTQAILKAHPPKPRPRRLEIADSPEP